MIITLTEALRLKNEVSNLIKTLHYRLNTSSHGTLTENDVDVTREEFSYPEVEQSLLNALSISEQLNEAISSANARLHVGDYVRKLQNAKLLHGVYLNSLSKSKASVNKRFETVGNTRETITVKFTPYVTSVAMKEKISTQKEAIRYLQGKIDQINQTTIELNFEYSDIENLS